MIHFVITLDGGDGLMAAEQVMLCRKVLRLNLSEVFQYLNVQSILNEMIEKKLTKPQKKGEVEAYSSKYAQNISAGIAMFSTMEIPPTFLLSLCDILEGTDCPDQMKLAVKLRSGLCCVYCRELILRPLLYCIVYACDKFRPWIL